ncbi:MAG: tRNA Pseudouridine synthase terminal, partial [Pseudonocardiales bacterium]|nr:tRNA Pseudouridine synthase terminal [Pseudonocardiales bacterium]
LELSGIAGTHGAIAPDGTVAALLVEDGGRAKPVLVFAAAG